MICCKCDKPFPGGCTCPDRDARLENLKTTATHVALRWCPICDQHADLCKCADGPTTLIRTSEGKFWKPPSPELYQWMRCPECGAAWLEGQCSRGMVDCECECAAVPTDPPGDDAAESAKGGGE